MRVAATSPIIRYPPAPRRGRSGAYVAAGGAAGASNRSKVKKACQTTDRALGARSGCLTHHESPTTGCVTSGTKSGAEIRVSSAGLKRIGSLSDQTPRQLRTGTGSVTSGMKTGAETRRNSVQGRALQTRSAYTPRQLRDGAGCVTSGTKSDRPVEGLNATWRGLKD